MGGVEEENGKCKMINANLAVPRNAKCSFEIMAEKVRMTKEEMAAGLEGLLQPDLKENVGFLVAPSASLYDSGRTIINFYLDRGQLSRPVDVKEVIESRFIEELAGK